MKRILGHVMDGIDTMVWWLPTLLLVAILSNAHRYF